MKSIQNLEIRDARATDAIEIAKFKAEVLSSTDFLMETREEVNVDAESARRQIENLTAGRLFLVAVADHFLIATLTFGRSEFNKIQHRGGLQMMVKKEYQAQGVGRAILQAFLDKAKLDKTLERIDLSVMSGNTAAIQLYEKFGFAREGIRPRAYKFRDGSYQDEVFMGLQLKPNA
jgi:RimJ/RimL family protein N-acetyltransferase